MPLDRGEKPGHLVAEGHGNGLLQVAAPDHRRIAMAARELGHRSRDRGEVVLDEREALADLQHRGGVGDVLSGGAPMAPFAQAVGAQLHQLLDHAQHRVADALGLRAQLLQVDHLEPAVAHDLRRRLCGDDAEPGLDARQSRLDVEIFARAVLVGPHLAHGLGAEEVAEDGGVNDGCGYVLQAPAQGGVVSTSAVASMASQPSWSRAHK